MATKFMNLTQLLDEEQRLLDEFEEAQMDYRWWNNEKGKMWRLTPADIEEGDLEYAQAVERARNRLNKVQRKIRWIERYC